MCRRHRRRPQCHCHAHIALLTPHTIATTPSAVPKEMHSASPKDKEKDKNVKFEKSPKTVAPAITLTCKTKNTASNSTLFFATNRFDALQSLKLKTMRRTKMKNKNRNVNGILPCK
jgi:hypothetical protein